MQMLERDATGMADKKRQELRRKLHQKVDEAIERMCDKTQSGLNPYDLDFTGRESLADHISKELGALLLQENLFSDTFLEIVKNAKSWQCPLCEQDCPRHVKKDGDEQLDCVTLKTKVGAVDLDLPQFRCGKCRKLFSPLQVEP